MSNRYKSHAVPPPHAHGYVEMRIAGRMTEAAWTLRGDQLTVVSPVGQAHGARRDPCKGSVEEQARGMLLELWLKLRDQRAAERCATNTS